jgi:hypothetical protein
MRSIICICRTRGAATAVVRVPADDYPQPKELPSGKKNAPAAAVRATITA